MQMKRSQFKVRFMKKWLFWVLVVALAFTVYQHHYRPQEIVRQFSGLPESLSGKYMSARFAERHHEHALAAESLAQALKKDPTNLRLLEHSFALHVMSGKMDEAIADAARYRELSPRAFAANNMLAIAEMKKGNFEVFPRWKQLFVRIGVVDQHDKFYFFQETTTGEGNSESSKLGT